MPTATATRYIIPDTRYDDDHRCIGCERVFSASQCVIVRDNRIKSDIDIWTFPSDQAECLACAGYSECVNCGDIFVGVADTCLACQAEA